MTDKRLSLLESLVEQVDPVRRQLLRRSLMAGGTIVLAAPASSLLVQTKQLAGAVENEAHGETSSPGKGSP